MFDNIDLEKVIFDWNDEKNKILLEERWVCFEDIVFALKDGRLIEIIKNPSSNFENQYCMVVRINEYVYLVPFVIWNDKVFLKTIFPSRKFNKLYL